MSIFERIKRYQERQGVTLGAQLGDGHHGTVFVAVRNPVLNRSAVKFHNESEPFERELSVYERLKEREVFEIDGFAVPLLLGADRELLALEMTIVQPPFLLDFGGAYLDRVPQFPDNVWEEWREQKAEQFEKDWPIVEDVLTTLRCLGIHLLDVHPRNIAMRRGD